MFSSSRAPAVSVYPDSDKIGVWPGDEENDLVFSRGWLCRGPETLRRTHSALAHASP